MGSTNSTKQGDNYAEMTDDQLLAANEKIKSKNKTDSFLFGLVIGITIFSVMKNGINFFVLLPLLVLPLLSKTKKKTIAIADEICNRNLGDNV